jgi:hypothetical protein
MAMIATATSLGRDDHLVAVKGVCIIAVAAIHGLKFDLFAVAARQASNFAVVIFFGLASYFSGRSQTRGSPRFICNRAVVILLAYFIACLVKDGALLADPMPFRSNSLDGTAITIGYFVIVLLQMTVLIALIARIPSLRLQLVVIALGTAAGLTWTYGLKAGLTPLALLAYFALPFFAWRPPCHVGFSRTRKRGDRNRGAPRGRRRGAIDHIGGRGVCFRRAGQCRARGVAAQGRRAGICIGAAGGHPGGWFALRARQLHDQARGAWEDVVFHLSLSSQRALASPAPGHPLCADESRRDSDRHRRDRGDLLCSVSRHTRGAGS